MADLTIFLSIVTQRLEIKIDRSIDSIFCFIFMKFKLFENSRLQFLEYVFNKRDCVVLFEILQ